MNEQVHQGEIMAIKACQAGNAHAFGALYDAHVRSVYDYIYYKTFHKETAEDLTSHAFIKAIDNIQSFQPEKAQFRTWLLRIAHNLVVDYYRTRKNDINIDDASQQENTGNKENLLETTHTHLEIERIKELIQELPQTEQDILRLRLWQDIPYKEISEIVGKSEANCKMIFSRGVKKIRASVTLFFVGLAASLLSI